MYFGAVLFFVSSFCVYLIFFWDRAECGNRKALRLRSQGVYLCKWPSLNVENNTASTVLCNGLIYARNEFSVQKRVLLPKK